MEAQGTPPTEDQLRERAVRRIKRKQAFRTHLMAYVLVNAMLIAIWAATGADFFWPMFPLLGWGIGLALDAWDAYGRGVVTEDQIRREMERLRR